MSTLKDVSLVRCSRVGCAKVNSDSFLRGHDDERKELRSAGLRIAVIYFPSLRGTNQNLCECSGTFERSRVPSRSIIFLE